MLITHFSIQALPTNYNAESLNTNQAKEVNLPKNNLAKLIYFERGDDINVATPALHQTQCGAHLPRTQVPGSVAREKQIKAGSRKKKIELIEGINPEWKDLFEEYFGKKIV